MQADDVDAHRRKVFGQFFGRGVVGRVGARGDVEAEESRAGAVLKIEVAVFGLDKAVLARRGVQQVGVVQRACKRLGHTDADVLFHGKTS